MAKIKIISIDGIRLPNLFSIPFYMEWSFLFLLILLIAEPLAMKVTYVTVFGSIILHELAHCYAAHLLGYKTEKITLGFFGGLAYIIGLDDKRPWDIFRIILPGPYTNILLGLLGLLIYNLCPPVSSKIDELVRSIITLQFVIAAFNLLPIGILDGGRIFRSFLMVTTSGNWPLTLWISSRVTAIATITLITIAAVVQLYGIIIILAFVLVISWAEYIEQLRRNELATAEAELDRIFANFKKGIEQ